MNISPIFWTEAKANAMYDLEVKENLERHGIPSAFIIRLEEIPVLVRLTREEWIASEIKSQAWIIRKMFNAVDRRQEELLKRKQWEESMVDYW
jgi:hypothetical protein